MILGLIPARGGSKRLPRKNVRLLCGRPLIAWSILEAQKSPYIDRLCVTTEDDEIAEVARDYRCHVIKRPIHLAHDRSIVYGTILHAVDAQSLGLTDSVCLMQATSPLMIADDINRCIETHLNSKKPTMTVEFGKSFANGAVYCGTVEWLRKGGNWDNGEPQWVAMPPERSVDINEFSEFKEAETLMLARHAA